MHRAWLLTLLVLPGCLRAGYDRRAADGPVPQDTARPDLPALDLPRPDSVRPKDLPLPDLPLPDLPPPCASAPDPDTVALLTFEGSGNTVSDATGKHPGAVVGSGVARVPGQAGCGKAVAFPNAITDYVTIPDSPDWDLTQGSVDFWVRIDTPSPAGFRGIVSRDANQQALPGHFTVFQLCDGGLAVRLQKDLNDRDVRCSTPVSLGVWHHVGVNFGPGGLALYIDGVEATRSETLKSCTFQLQCGTSGDQGLAGNDNPWVLGASSSGSVEGQATPVVYPFDGAIDSFRVSSVRRAFAATP